MQYESQWDRRVFFEAALAGVLAETAAAAESDTLPRPSETRKGDMLYRTFGKTGETVSVIGVGGSHIGETSSDDLATRIVRTAIDRGINFMDISGTTTTGTAKAKSKWERRCATATARRSS